MSGILTGAVFQQGPAVLRPRVVLAAIAEAADDHGFAVQSIETIAMKAVCDPRTAMRVVKWLELEGWLQVRRRAVDGKASVYFVNIVKLGVVLNAKSRKNEWHMAFERKHGGAKPARISSGDKVSPMHDLTPADTTLEDESDDNMSPDFPGAASEESGDISGGVQVTKQPESGDILPLPIRKNRVSRVSRVDTPPTPSQARGAAVLRTVLDAPREGAMQECILGGELVRMDPGVVMGPEFLESAMESRAKGVSDAARHAGAIVWGVAQVMRALDVAENARLERLVGDELDRHCAKTKCTAQAAAELAIANVKTYRANAEYLRFTWGWPKFFREGHWRSSAMWPYDQARLQRRRDASVGIYEPNQ